MKLFCTVFAAVCMFFRIQQTPLTELSTARLHSPTPIVWPARIPILMYHYVEYVEDKGDTIRQSLNIPRTYLRRRYRRLLTQDIRF
jgi:hypothetical protein